MRDDERMFAIEVLKASGIAPDVREFPRDIGARLGIHPKRVVYLCEKWADNHWYDYGVSTDLGWLTPEGIAHFQEIVTR